MPAPGRCLRSPLALTPPPALLLRVLQAASTCVSTAWRALEPLPRLLTDLGACPNTPFPQTPLWTQLNQDIGIGLTVILYVWLRRGSEGGREADLAMILHSMLSVYYGNIWSGLSFPCVTLASAVRSARAR